MNSRLNWELSVELYGEWFDVSNERFALFPTLGPRISMNMTCIDMMVYMFRLISRCTAMRRTLVVHGDRIASHS